MRRILLGGFLLLLAACAGVAPPKKLGLEPVEFAELPGWNEDSPNEALAAFARSCAVLLKKPAGAAMGAAGKAGDWKKPCAALTSIPRSDPAAARAFFETYFTPHAASGADGNEGLFTGYYEAELYGSTKKTKRFHVPLYARPKDLVTVDLGLFRPEWKGQRILGKVDKTRFVPYDERAAIAKNPLPPRAEVLLWVDDPIGAFFLEIQGSGRVRMPDGSIRRIGYDGTNGRGYVAIGKPLAARGDIQKPVTMQKIRAWLSEHPVDRQAALNLNPSYVFFRKLEKDEDGPIGAQGVALTPLRSLAVDPAYIPLGVPLWLATQNGDGKPIRRLVIAQDTGGAIKGAVRGDVFWGAGTEAEAEAGTMQSRGRYFLLLPKTDAR
ncbi:MAG: murein transglycosylase A [Bdellovibrionales bacterium]